MSSVIFLLTFLNNIALLLTIRHVSFIFSIKKIVLRYISNTILVIIFHISFFIFQIIFNSSLDIKQIIPIKEK